MSLKHELYSQCQKLVDKRYQVIQQHIADLQQSLSSETKSSAGDKHETGRAMVQLEREKAGRQLAEINKVRASLSQIDPDRVHTHVGQGSLVFTSKANYFIAASLGPISLKDETYYAISPGTPIGRLLMGKIEKDEVTFNGNSFVIESLI